MKNDNNKNYIILSIFVLVSLALVVFFVYPLLREIEKNSSDLVSAKDSIIALKAQANEVESFKKNYEGYKPSLDKMDRLFIDPKNPVDFIEFIENTAYNSGVTSQISIAPSSADEQQYVALQLSSEGSFSDILNFVKNIEKGPYLIEIENLTIQGRQTTTKDPKTSDATFTIKAFIKK